MKILSVNIAVPRMIEVSGKTVETGIYKMPVEEPQRIEAFGLARDRRIEPRKFGERNHAVHIYPQEHYAFWQSWLCCAPFPYGQFGENLTVSGLLESHVRIGDIVRCGTAVLQVTQPRIPCRKLNVRMGHKFSGVFLRSRRVGYFLRVLEEGQAEAGDSVELLDSDPDSPTVDDFVRIALIDYWDVEGLEFLLQAKRLIPEWREILEDKLHRARTAEGWLGLRELEIARRVDECEGVASFYLQCPFGRPLAPFRAGQYVSLALRPSPISPESRRAYAISSGPADHNTYRITVQLRPAPVPAVPDGTVSSALYRDFGPGSTVRIAAPRGMFTFDEVRTDCNGLLFIAEGIGIAPVASMLRHWTRTMRHAPACLVHSVENRRVQPLRDEMLGIAAANKLLRLRFAYTDPQPGEELGRDYHIHGALTAEDLSPLLPPALGSIFLAGRSAFVKDVRAILQSLGVAEKQLHIEEFGA